MPTYHSSNQHIHRVGKQKSQGRRTMTLLNSYRDLFMADEMAIGLVSWLHPLLLFLFTKQQQMKNKHPYDYSIISRIWKEYQTTPRAKRLKYMLVLKNKVLNNA